MLSSTLYSLKPLIVLSNATGFLNFSINAEKPAVFVSGRNVLMSLLSLAVNAAVFLVFWRFEPSCLFFASDLTKHLIPLMISLNQAFLVATMAWYFLRRRDFLTLLSLVAAIDKALADLGATFDYRRQRKALTVAIVAAFTVIALMSVAAEFAHKNGGLSVLETLSLLWITVMGTTYVFQFLVGALIAGSRFDMMNGGIASGKDVAAVHLKIVEFVRRFNVVFGMPMMCAFGNSFAWSCISSFNFVVMAESERGVFALATLLFGSFFTWGMLVLIVGAAERATRAKERAVELLYARMCEANRAELGSFVSQVVDTNVTFSCRFFDFNWRMLFNFVSANVMYFIILMQFEDAKLRDSKNM